jgi:hypothetical protein
MGPRFRGRKYVVLVSSEVGRAANIVMHESGSMDSNLKHHALQLDRAARKIVSFGNHDCAKRTRIANQV